MVSTVGQTVLHRNERGTTRLELKIAASKRVHYTMYTTAYLLQSALTTPGENLCAFHGLE